MDFILLNSTKKKRMLSTMSDFCLFFCVSQQVRPFSSPTRSCSTTERMNVSISPAYRSTTVHALHRVEIYRKEYHTRV